MKIINYPEEIEENVEIYETVVKNLCKLFMELGFYKDAIKIYENYIYMYTNGYLSYKKEFSNNSLEKFNILESSGVIPMDIAGSILMTGYGVCRHTTDFLYYVYYYLAFENARLFVYNPNTHIEINNYSKKDLDNFEIQKYIDEALKNIDLFSKEELYISKKFNDIEIKIKYLPSIQTVNHAINIVKSKKDETSHILDSRYYGIGEKIDDKCILLDQLGLKKKVYPKNAKFDTYYGTDYWYGLFI